MKYQCTVEIQQRQNRSSTKCPSCRSLNSFIGDIERQEIICKKCGTVISEDTSNIFDYNASTSIQLAPPVSAPYASCLSINRNQN